jgi:hypothetical protein
MVAIIIQRNSEIRYIEKADFDKSAYLAKGWKIIDRIPTPEPGTPADPVNIFNEIKAKTQLLDSVRIRAIELAAHISILCVLIDLKLFTQYKRYTNDLFDRTIINDDERREIIRVLKDQNVDL